MLSRSLPSALVVVVIVVRIRCIRMSARSSRANKLQACALELRCSSSSALDRRAAQHLQLQLLVTYATNARRGAPSAPFINRMHTHVVIYRRSRTMPSQCALYSLPLRVCMLKKIARRCCAVCSPSYFYFLHATTTTTTTVKRIASAPEHSRLSLGHDRAAPVQRSSTAPVSCDAAAWQRTHYCVLCVLLQLRANSI